MDTVEGDAQAGYLLAVLNRNQSNDVPQLASSRLRFAEMSIFRSISNAVLRMHLHDIVENPESKNSSILIECAITFIRLIHDIDALMMKRQKRVPQLVEPFGRHF